MRRMLILLLILLLPLLFAPGTPPPPEANWRIIAGMAAIVSALLLGALYMVAYGFGIQELKFLAVEEFYQLVVTLIMIGVLVGMQASVESAFTGTFGMTLPAKAEEILQERLDAEAVLLTHLQSFSGTVGEEASKSAFCSIMGVGMSMASCGGYRALSTPVSLVYQIVAVGIAELGALHTLVDFAGQYAFPILLPAGILLRTFRITRGAGGLLIAFAISLYALLPLGVIGMKDISDEVLTAMVSAHVVGSDMDAPQADSCDAFSMFSDNYVRAQTAYLDLNSKSGRYIYEFLINATLTAIIGLTMLITGTRAIAQLTGAEVDVSALARVA